MQFSRRILISGSAIIIVFAALSVSFIRSGQRAESDKKEESTTSSIDKSFGSSAIPVSVEAALVKRDKLIKRITANGIAKAEKKVTIQTEVGGKLISLKVKDGQLVRANELLAKIDDTEYKLKVSRAEEARINALAKYATMQMTESPDQANDSKEKANELKNAQEKWEQAKKNFQEGLISEKQLERARKDYDLAKIMAGVSREEVAASQVRLKDAEVALEEAKLNLARTEIRAPFSGIIAGIEVVEGEHLSPNKILCKLVDLSTIKVEAYVLESEIGLIQKGRGAKVTFPAYPGKVFAGKISFISPTVDSTNKTCKVTLHLANPERLIKDGMYAQVGIDSQIYADRLIVPQEAILEREGRKLVFLIKNKRSNWIYIRTGVENEEYAEILSENEGEMLWVKEGDLVITGGHYTLAHDALVRVVNKQELNLN